MSKSINMRYETEIQIIQSSMQKLNKQFALVDILLCYSGRNRNYSDISKEVIENALPSLYGIPIIGEWIYKDDGSQDFGSHGGRIILDSEGIKFEQTTKPFGFITKDAVETASWVTMTEKNGHTQHDYLQLKGCIIWNSRYEETNVLLDANYGQSMEIEIDKYEYDQDDYIVINELTFSAACILGTDIVPCFESACIGRHYSLDSFKQEYTKMLDEYKNFELSQKTQKGEKMDLVKITEALSTFTFKDKSEVEVGKYMLIGNPTDNQITIIDKEEKYRVYAVDYAPNDSDIIVFDWNSKVEKALDVVEKTEATHELSTVINDFAQLKSEATINKITEELTEHFNTKIDEMAVKFDDVNEKLGNSNKKLKVFENEKAEKEKEVHKDSINAIVEKYSQKIGKYPKFLVYKAKLNPHEVTVEQVEQDLALMTGRAMMEGNKKDFSYIPEETNVKTKRDLSGSGSRYGNLLDKYKSI